MSVRDAPGSNKESATIQPREAVQVSRHEVILHGRRAFLVAGCYAYLACTVAFSARYAFLMQQSATNDYYRRDFNTTGTQTYLADLYNSQLSLVDGTGATGFASNTSLGLQKSYANLDTAIDMSPSRARKLLLQPLRLDQEITSMRNSSLNANLNLPTPFCWVGCTRKFELGHSAKRQLRCLQMDTPNAAVYLESVLRNTRRSDILASLFYPMVNATIFAPLRRTPTGPAWLTYIHNHTFRTAAGEVQLWNDYGLDRWTNQLTNRYQRGIEETITIENALGLQEVIKIYSAAYSASAGTPSTNLACALFGNELYVSYLYLGSTLVRGDPLHFEQLGIDWDVYVMIGPRTTPAINLVRRHIGAFGTLDIRFVPAPHSLTLSVAQFRRELVSALQENGAALDLLDRIEPVATTPVPPSWRLPMVSFFGGNPMCVFGTAQPFVQASFGNYDTCSSQQPHVVLLEWETVLFALAAMDGLASAGIDRVCAVNAPFDPACADALALAASVHASLALKSSIVASMWADVAAANISLIQFATINRTERLFVQPWISTPTDPWSFYGWIVMYEWVQGKREVYIFEGDQGAYTTISPSRDFDPLAANPLELPQNACTYVRYVAIYVTFALSGIALVIAAFGASAKFRIGGVHLLQFNRVVGSVWIGRPFLLLRGMTAVVLLSTANVEFVAPNGFSQLQLQPRSFFDIAVLAGETTWVSYVAIDFILPLLGDIPKYASPASSFLEWLVVGILEISTPVVATATLRSECKIHTVDILVICSAGAFTVGSSQRLVLICVIHVASAALSIVGALIWRRWQRDDQRHRRGLGHLLVPMAAQANLSASVTSSDASLDSVACVMSGMIPFGSMLFDAKLWGFVPIDHERKTAAYMLTQPTFQRKATTLPRTLIAARDRFRLMRLKALVGLGYIALTLSASYAYLVLTESTMANDFWWAAFNTTGAETCLSMVFTAQLQLANMVAPTPIDNTQFGDSNIWYGATKTSVVSSSLYATSIQDEVNSLPNVVRGLRKMDGCQQPRIFTAHCYVDFDREWEMANSAERQRRCCYGTELTAGVFGALDASSTGQAWLRSVRSNALSVSEEVDVWTSKGIATYSGQWQNYKRLGVIEFVSIQNAFGISHPITIKKANSTVNLANQYTYKMYWGLANDLLAMRGNASLLAGKSLVRGSPNFAFQNTSMERVLVSAGVLPPVLGPNLAVMRAILGPFGSVDVKRVPCPQSARDLYQAVTETLINILAQPDAVRFNYSATPTTMQLAPRTNVVCEFGTRSGNDVIALFSIDIQCGALQGNSIVGSRRDLMKGLMAANLVDPASASTTTICSLETRNVPSCRNSIGAARSFLRNFDMPPGANLTMQAREDIGTNLPVELVQHIRTGATYRLARVNLFDPSEATHELYSWLYVFDWVAGNREVIALHGSVGKLKTISNVVGMVSQTADAMEVPVNVSYYIRCSMVYVTFLMLVVGVFAACYVVAMRGYVESWNLLEINRVAGVVWIGRPLILLRAITAICLLSTPPLELTRSPSQLVTYFASPTRAWFTTFMSCGEMSWLVYIINDVFSPVTQQYTAGYSYKSSNLAWAVTFLLSLLAPVQNEFSINRACTVDAVDFQLVCHSGTLEVGRSARLFALIGVAFGSCVACYAFDRVRLPNLKPRDNHTSLFLHAVAKNNFEFAGWKQDDLYFLDKSSAVLNGLLSVHVGDNLVVFDVKSWRMFAFDTKTIQDGATRTSLQCAIPLVE